MSSLTKMFRLVELQKNTQCMRYLSYLKPNKISVESANKLTSEQIQLFHAKLSYDFKEFPDLWEMFNNI